MIIHFWPIAAVLALRNVIRARKKKGAPNPDPLENGLAEGYSL